MASNIQNQVRRSIKHLLSQVDRNPYSQTYGCFDRRYWAWKMVDFPEATFQRNILPLAWSIRQPANFWGPEKEFLSMRSLLEDVVMSGLRFATKIQHRNGSFDQAFPNEYSYGATAFLLYPLIYAFGQVKKNVIPNDSSMIMNMIVRASDFLVNNDEKHGTITNHLAGSSHALFEAYRVIGDVKYRVAAENLLKKILDSQSEEGWFPEYQGADPGYQTLCLYYLALIYQEHHRSEKIEKSLKKAFDFISYFVHPDGSFAGEYGSRRTSVFYPGGFSILAEKFLEAKSVLHFMIHSIEKDNSVSLIGVDMGNMAPLLSNYLHLYEYLGKSDSTLESSIKSVPSISENVSKNFEHSGFYIQGNDKYYSILSYCNGGVLKVFDVQRKKCVYNDCGYILEKFNGAYFTNQAIDLRNSLLVRPSNKVKLIVKMSKLTNVCATPLKYFVLRAVNLTIMRSVFWGNLIKKILVFLLLFSKKNDSYTLERTIDYNDDSITIDDCIKFSKSGDIKSVIRGTIFSSVHMASYGYMDASSWKSNRVVCQDFSKNEFRIGKKIVID